MSHTEAEIRRARQKYLEECATSCPRCGGSREATRIRRFLPSGPLSTPADDRPTVRLACRCIRCGGWWAEVYRLEDVELGEGEDATR